MIEAASRMQNIKTQFFANLSNKIMKLEADGIEVIRLDIGSPDMPPPVHIIDALSKAAHRDDAHGYQSHLGTPALRNAWAQMYKRVYEVEIDPLSEIVPLMGSKEGIFHIINAYTSPGDVVLIPDPGYLTYGAATQYAGGQVYFMPLLPENEFLPDLSAIPQDIASRAKMIWINYPNNPTSAIAPSSFFHEIIAFARKNQLIVCHDSSYSQVTFDDYRAPSIFEVDPRKEVSIEFNTLSKSHNMAGWRIGAAMGNAQVLKNLYTLKTQVDSGHFLPILEAATLAMESDQEWLLERNRIYQKRRDIIFDTIQKIGLEAQLPKASLYVWFKVPKGWTSNSFCEALLDDIRLSLTPGPVFGDHGEGFVRICFCAKEKVINEAMERLESWMAS